MRTVCHRLSLQGPNINQSLTPPRGLVIFEVEVYFSFVF